MQGWGAYWFVAVALFASTVSPYEVFFFSSGGVEEQVERADLADARSNVLIGFPVGGFLALSLVATAAVVFHPSGRRCRAPRRGRASRWCWPSAGWAWRWPRWRSSR